MKFDKTKADPFLLEEGDYYFEVLEAADTVFEIDDQAIPQIKVVLRLSWDTEEGERTSLLNQWLCSQRRLYLLKQFLYSVGLGEDWEAEEVDTADLFGLSGSCRVEQYQSNKGTMRNKVAEWYPLEEQEEKPKKKAKKPKSKTAKQSYGTDLDDDIPF